MLFQIAIRQEAADHFRAFSARDRSVIQQSVASRLASEPTKESKAIKRLQPNRVAEFQLKVGDFRVLYNVDVPRSLVSIVLIGEKRGNQLFVEGEAYHDHESDDLS